MSPRARPPAFAVLGIAGVDLWLGLGAARLGLGLPAALSLAGALAALLTAREFWHG
jgi:hypothetical protein